MHDREPTLTPGELGTIACRTLVVIGGDDESASSTRPRCTGACPRGELAVVPGTSHGLLMEKPDLCNLLITGFLTKDPVQTFAPIRRPAAQADIAPAPM